MNYKLIIIAATLFSVGGSATAKDKLSMQHILSIAKMTGACGILQSMSAFQASTKFEGGDQFVERFWNTEAARLGKTPEQYVTDCQASINGYENLWKLAEESGK